MQSSKLMQAKNAVGSNTPGVASSAADLESQEAPESRPKPEKIDVEKQHVLGIDFYRVQAPFSEDYFLWFFEGNAELISNCE